MKNLVLALSILTSILMIVSCGQSEKGNRMSHNAELMKLADEYFNSGKRDSALTVYSQIADNAAQEKANRLLSALRIRIQWLEKSRGD